MLNLNKGFSLLELIVVSAVIIILLTVGVPTLQKTLVQSRVNNHIYNLAKDILLARNHAVHHAQQVVICHLNTQHLCDTHWSKGYSVFIDRNRDEIYQANTDKLILERDYQTFNDIILFSGNNQLKYDADGHLNGLSGTFKYCPPLENDEEYARAVVVSLSGRPKVSKDIDGDGKDELNQKSKHISCKS